MVWGNDARQINFYFDSIMKTSAQSDQNHALQPHIRVNNLIFNKVIKLYLFLIIFNILKI